MYVFLCTLLYVSSYLLQRNIYLPVKYTASIVDYLTDKYPLMELARARKYIVNPKWHFVYALHHRSRDVGPLYVLQPLNY